jgi:uncharacterized membrane protein YoaK (UPF0700 family)
VALKTWLALSAKKRTRRTNRQLGAILAIVAGAINAGGFLAVGQYTSHMTGIISASADALVLGQFELVAAGAMAVVAFIAGAMTTTIQINWARRQKLHGEYAWSLMLEALLLLFFGVLGNYLNHYREVFVPVTVLLLCFIMGLQNAIITKLSAAEIRTTHMTGIVTDLGIELGRLVYWNRIAPSNAQMQVVADRSKLKIHLLMLCCFVFGALVGAMAFKRLSFFATVPFSVVLMMLAVPPIYMDVRKYQRIIFQK